MIVFFFSSRRRHTRFDCDWSSDVCSSDLPRYDPMAGFTHVAYIGSVANVFVVRSEEHTSELQSQSNLVCRLLLEKKKKKLNKPNLQPLKIYLSPTNLHAKDITHCQYLQAQ